MIRNLYPAILIIFMTLSSWSCNGPVEDSTTDSQEAINYSMEDAPAETTLSADQAKDLVLHYLSMKENFVTEARGLIKGSAHKMLESLEDMEEDELAESMEEHLKEIAGEDELPDMRQAFRELSVNIYHLLKLVETERELYWQHCPMAFGGEGANWLSHSQEIRNPYFGEEMLKCGETVEVL